MRNARYRHHGRRSHGTGTRLGWWASLAVFLAIALVGKPPFAHEHTLPQFVRLLPPEGAISQGGAKNVSSQSTESVCRLTLNLIDAATGKPRWGLVRIKTSDGRVQQLEGLFNRGMRLRQDHPGKDWHVVLNSAPVLVPRQPLTVERWLNALRRGGSFITNGPLLELRVGKYGVGDVIRLSHPETLDVAARAIGRCDFQKLELVHNGRVVAWVKIIVV